MNSFIGSRKLLTITASFKALVLLSLFALLVSPSPSYAAFPGTNGKIVFESQRDGTGQIYVMNPDGTGQTRLTFNTADDGSPEWSADGTQIVFDSTRDGIHEIYVMDADGSGQARLTNNSDIDNAPTWSPDSTKIAFTSRRDGNEEIYVMNADGTAQTNLSNNSASDANPVWSPDGTKIAFHSNRNGNPHIFVMNADGSDVAQLTTSGSNGGPAWSPDGTKIAFHSNLHGNFDIYAMNADGSGQTQLTSDLVGATDPAWSPDGTKIVFESQRDDNYEVYVMNADATGQTKLTNNSAVDFRPNWGRKPNFRFTGFLQPVDNLPVLNSVKAGQAVPVKFSLGGDQGLNIFEANYPKSQQIACESTATLDSIEQTVTAGSSSLSYDPSTDTYTYVWKTEKAWSGTCRQLVVKLNDGTSQRANFKFK